MAFNGLKNVLGGGKRGKRNSRRKSITKKNRAKAKPVVKVKIKGTPAQVQSAINKLSEGATDAGTGNV